MEQFAAQVLLQPDASAAEATRVVQAFAALGFKTGPVVGHSFAIEAEGGRFASVFGVRLQALPTGRVAIQGAPASTPAGELPRTTLPSELQAAVTHVLFTEPPDFGPGGGFSEPAP